MTNAQSALRSLMAYAICVPLAIFIGYVLSTPLDRSTFYIFGVLAAVMCAPLLLRYHYPMMLVSWNTTAVVFFLPGRPQLWLATIAISFGISFLQRILNKNIQPIRVPELAWPLLLLAVLVWGTSMMTGGIGTQALGGSVSGGKRYFYIWLAIVGFFALTAHRIPLEKVNLYIGLFFLGATTALLGDLFPVLGSKIPYLFWVIPPFTLRSGELDLGLARLGGVTAAALGIFPFFMARYGVQGIFLSGKPWRFVGLVIFTFLGLYGGFRSMLIFCLLLFMIQFFLEGMHRTKLMPKMILGAVLVGALAFPFASSLPPTIQRSFAFLPIPIDPFVKESAKGSNEWRLSMWKAVLPQVPEYLWLGKGLAMTQEELEFASQSAMHAITEDEWGSALAGDYHNGPLSVIIPFGIWGMILWIWIQVAGFRIMVKNYKYGDPRLKVVNSSLLAAYLAKTLLFWLIVGGFYADLIYFTGLLGLSVAINGGVARPVTETTEIESQPSSLEQVLPARRPAFGR